MTSVSTAEANITSDPSYFVPPCVLKGGKPYFSTYTKKCLCIHNVGFRIRFWLGKEKPPIITSIEMEESGSHFTIS
jgi:hypothetical protein